MTGTQVQLSGGAALSRRDKEFLPGILEVLETPPSPINMALIWTICALVVVALAWSYIGRLDIIAVAQGKIQPVGRSKVVQPLATGKVMRILATNGSKVHAGEPLVELDPREAKADESTYRTAVATENAEILRRQTALEAVRARHLDPQDKIEFPSEIRPEIAAREQAVFKSDITALQAEIAGLQLQVEEKNAEADGLVATILSEQRLVATLSERVQMRESLVAMNAVAKSSLLDARETLQTQDTYLSNLNGQLTQARAAAKTATNAIETAYGKFLADYAQKLADANRLRDEAAEKLTKAQITTSHLTLVSPIDGIVQGSVVTSAGQVLTVGEEIMQIIPEDAEIEIECYLPNQDIGFVKPNEDARVKIDAFPFTRYGTVDAIVKRVATDAIPAPEAEQREGNPTAPVQTFGFGGAQRMRNLVFPVTLALKQKTINVDGVSVPLSPGMSVNVEIKTGSRRVIEYVLSPLVELTSESARER